MTHKKKRIAFSGRVFNLLDNCNIFALPKGDIKDRKQKGRSAGNPLISFIKEEGTGAITGFNIDCRHLNEEVLASKSDPFAIDLEKIIIVKIMTVPFASEA